MRRHSTSPWTPGLDDSRAKALTVLVADDTLANRNLMQLFVNKLGFSVVLADNGREAVAVYERERPDIVLMDLMMPQMDGYEATRRIRAVEHGQWTPIIIMSALNADADIVAGLDAGGDDYLVKPVSFAVFAAKMRTVQRLLEMERGHRELLGRVQAISNAVIDGIVTTDERGRIQSANPAVHRMFGYADGTLVGRDVTILMPPAEAGRHGDYMARRVAGETPVALGRLRELTGKHADGRMFPLEVGVSQLNVEDRCLFIGVLRDISERVRVREERELHAVHLQRYHDEQQREQQLARQIMARQIDAAAMSDPRIHFSVMPAQHFSGDLVVAAASPSGRLYAMLADATGHGLSAAVSVQPVLPLFYALVAADVPMAQMVRRINHLLHTSLPIGRFVGASLMCLDAAGTAAEVWVGGVPEVLVVGADGGIRKRIASRQLPLGVVDSTAEACEPEALALSRGEQLMLYSDGVLEAANVAAEAFGRARLEQIVDATPRAGRVGAIKLALAEHLAGESAHDDISLLLIDAEPATPPAAAIAPAT